MEQNTLKQTISGPSAQGRGFDLSSAALHVLAMIFMLCDHLWATVVPGNEWLTCVGRLAFPIFAFMTVEGFSHTSSLKRYVLRLLLFAAISEIPFNLMYGGSVIYPFQQNVLWTFLLGIGMMQLNEAARRRGKVWLNVLTASGTVLLGYLAGLLTFVDYGGAGVLTVLAFYFFRGRRWWQLLGQLAALYYINFELLSGLYYDVELFGYAFELHRQNFALFALIPIWLYRGRQGYHSKWFQYFCYAFYPAHILILHLISQLL